MRTLACFVPLMITLACSAPEESEAPPVALWDWTQIVGSGQSLAVGAQAQSIATTTSSFGNLKLSLGDVMVPPFESTSDPSLSVVPLAEPIRRFANRCCAYPENIYGETPHTAMADQIATMVQLAGGTDYVSVHSVVGENGQPMSVLRKGATESITNTTTTGFAYEATLFETTVLARLAAEAGKTFGVGAVVLTHGESDANLSDYEEQLFQLWSDYNTDLSAITGQTEPIVMLVSQQHSLNYRDGVRTGMPRSTLAQWQAGLDDSRRIVCSGPKYQYPMVSDNLHLARTSYQLLGEKYGEVYYEVVVRGRDWQPLQPISGERDGAIARVAFHVPVPPLAWDDVLPRPHQTALTEWAEGRGFELRMGDTPLTIESVAIVGDTIELTTTSDIPAGATVGYAATSDGTELPGISRRWGQLRDSDATVGVVTGTAQPNYAVAFELPLP